MSISGDTAIIGAHGDRNQTGAAYVFTGISDCNLNGNVDICDIDAGTSQDCQPNGIPDECEADCNSNGTPDDCDLAGGTSEDCNDNRNPDECDIAGGTSEDCNANNTPDECDKCGDYDDNSVTDVNDYAVFHACFGGPTTPIGGCPCSFFDCNADGYIDLFDFWWFMQCVP